MCGLVHPVKMLWLEFVHLFVLVNFLVSLFSLTTRESLIVCWMGGFKVLYTLCALPPISAHRENKLSRQEQIPHSAPLFLFLV